MKETLLTLLVFQVVTSERVLNNKENNKVKSGKIAIFFVAFFLLHLLYLTSSKHI